MLILMMYLIFYTLLIFLMINTFYIMSISINDYNTTYLLISSLFYEVVLSYIILFYLFIITFSISTLFIHSQ